MNRFSPRWVALWIAVLVAVYLCWLMVQPFIEIILWAAVMAIVSFPLNLRLRRRFGPAGSAALTTSAVVLVVLAPLVFVAFSMVNEAAKVARTLPSGVHKVLNPDSAILKKLGHYVDVGPLLDPQFISEKLKMLATALASKMAGLLGGALGIGVQIFFVLFTLFYLLRDSDRILQNLREWLPLSQIQSEPLLRRTHEVISASLNGVLVIAAVQGALGGVGFLVLGISSPILWGVVMFLMSMIPMVGPFVVWGPAAIWLLASGYWIKATILVAWGAGVIGMTDNLLRPRLVGGKTRLHELVVLFSVLGGLQVFGILGIVIGPVVVAVTIGLLDALRQVNESGQNGPGAL